MSSDYLESSSELIDQRINERRAISFYRTAQNTRIELLLYITAAVITCSIKLLTGFEKYSDLRTNYGLDSSVGSFLTSFIGTPDFLICLIPIFLPILFHLIFGFYPFQFLRRLTSADERRLNEEMDVWYENARKVSRTDSDSEVEDYYEKLALKSERVAQNLYTRGGIYLFVGVLIALSGLIYFSYNLTPNDVSSKSESLILPLSSLLPKAGALIFLELLA